MQSTIDNLTKRLDGVEHNKDTEASFTQHTNQMRDLIGKVDSRVQHIEKQDVKNMIKVETDRLQKQLEQQGLDNKPSEKTALHDLAKRVDSADEQFLSLNNLIDQMREQ